MLFGHHISHALFFRSKPVSESRKGTVFWMIGTALGNISGHKLPSNRQVLSCFLFNHLVLGKAKRESAELAIDGVLSFWQKARVPTRQPVKCWSKLEKLYEKYTTLKKNKGRAGDVQRRNKDFKSSLEDLFDIAHQNAPD